MAIEMLDLEAAREEIANGAKLIDVREQNEWDESHIDEAAHVPQGELVERLDEVAPDTSERLLLALPHRQPLREDGRRARVARLRQRRRGRGRDRRLGGRRAADRQRLGPDQRAADALLAPHAAPRGRGRGPAEAAQRRRCCCSAPAASARPTALYLAAAGIGTIGIVDDDVVDESNLQRQVIHNTERVGIAKTTSARMTIEALNPDVEVVEHNTRLDASNILELIEPYDVIVDGADNFPTRYLLNDASVRLRQAGRLGLDPRLRRPDLDLRPARGPLLPLPLPGAAAARARARAAAPTACSA